MNCQVYTCEYRDLRYDKYCKKYEKIGFCKILKKYISDENDERKRWEHVLDLAERHPGKRKDVIGMLMNNYRLTKGMV